MKNYLPLVSLCGVVGLSGITSAAQQPNSLSAVQVELQQIHEATTDAVIEPAPPAGIPGNPPSGSKVKRNKAVPAAAPRHGTTAEVKSFTFNRTFGGERSRPLIVRSAKADTKTTSQLQEDLAIMSRVLEKSAGEYRDDHEEAAGIPILALGGGKGIRALYLEDYGVLFTLSVNIPLQPELKGEMAEKPQNATNEEWNEARSELFADRRPAGGRGEHPRREFDQHQLDEFRDSLVEALRNAANIRNLQDSDWVTLVVRGRGAAGEGEPLEVLLRNGYAAGNGEYGFGRVASGDDRNTDSSTMVLRIKKGALDTFTRRKGSAEEFRQNVSILLY